jgi:hypothetical protein
MCRMDIATAISFSMTRDTLYQGLTGLLLTLACREQYEAQGLGSPDDLVKQLESAWGLCFKPGYNPDIKFMSHLWQPIRYISPAVLPLLHSVSMARDSLWKQHQYLNCPDEQCSHCAVPAHLTGLTGAHSACTLQSRAYMC